VNTHKDWKEYKQRGMSSVGEKFKGGRERGVRTQAIARNRVWGQYGN